MLAIACEGTKIVHYIWKYSQNLQLFINANLETLKTVKIMYFVLVQYIRRNWHENSYNCQKIKCLNQQCLSLFLL